MHGNLFGFTATCNLATYSTHTPSLSIDATATHGGERLLKREAMMVTSESEWQEFAIRLEWEGGIAGLLESGGPAAFPEEVREAALKVAEAISILGVQLGEHGVEDYAEDD